MKVKVIEISLHWELNELWPVVAFAHFKNDENQFTI